MLYNFLKVALRQIRKHKAYAFINVFGLSIAMACGLLMFLFIHQEWSYDAFHERTDSIYRVTRVDLNPDGSIRRLRGGHPMPTGPALVEEIAGIEQAVRFRTVGAWVRTPELNAQESITFADPPIFAVFTFPTAQGSPLIDPSSVVVSPAFAARYFGDRNPVGQTLSVKLEDDYQDYMVSGVLQPIPDHSSIKFDLLMSYRILEGLADYRDSVNNWYSNNSSLFVLLNENATAAGLSPLLDRFSAAHWVEDPRGLRLQPLREIHLDTTIGATFEPVSNPMFSYILGGIALFVIGIAKWGGIPQSAKSCRCPTSTGRP